MNNTANEEDIVKEEEDNERNFDFFDDAKLWLSYSRDNINYLISEGNCYNTGINENLRHNIEDLLKENLELKERLIDLKINEKTTECITQILQNKILETREVTKNISEELASIHIKKPQLLSETKEIVQKIKETYNSFKYAVKYYKNLFEIYIEVEKNDESLIVKICFLTMNVNNITHSVTLRKINNDNSWILESVKPELSSDQFTILQNQLAADNEVSTTICNIRKAFKLLYIDR